MAERKKEWRKSLRLNHDRYSYLKKEEEYYVSCSNVIHRQRTCWIRRISKIKFKTLVEERKVALRKWIILHRNDWMVIWRKQPSRRGGRAGKCWSKKVPTWMSFFELMFKVESRIVWLFYVIYSVDLNKNGKLDLVTMEWGICCGVNFCRCQFSTSATD